MPTRWTEGWVEATKKSTELSSGRDMKHRVRGLCLDTHGVSQRKQMNKSVQTFRSPPSLAIPPILSMDGWEHRLGKWG